MSALLSTLRVVYPAHGMPFFGPRAITTLDAVLLDAVPDPPAASLGDSLEIAMGVANKRWTQNTRRGDAAVAIESCYAASTECDAFRRGPVQQHPFTKRHTKTYQTSLAGVSLGSWHRPPDVSPFVSFFVPLPCFRNM